MAPTFAKISGSGLSTRALHLLIVFESVFFANLEAKAKELASARVRDSLFSLDPYSLCGALFGTRSRPRLYRV
jgi:hypothetical protein